jgi:hypothetical protein
MKALNDDQSFIRQSTQVNQRVPFDYLKALAFGLPCQQGIRLNPLSVALVRFQQLQPFTASATKIQNIAGDVHRRHERKVELQTLLNFLATAAKLINVRRNEIIEPTAVCRSRHVNRQSFF